MAARLFLRKCGRLSVRFMSSGASSTPLKEKSIGVIGMGHVGEAVTKNLLRNEYKVTSIYDIVGERCSGYPCKVSSSPREVTEENDIIITALPMPPHVKAAFEGEKGIHKGLSDGKIWIDHSTTNPEHTEAYFKLVQAAGAKMLEAPITGGMEALKKGQMTVLMAGEKAVADEMWPVLGASFQTVLYTGELGTALIPKVFSNMLAAVNIIALGEVMMVAKKAGIDLKTLWDCIRASSGNSFVWETGGPMVMQGTYDPSFSMELHCKDNQLGFDIAKKYKVPLNILGVTQQIYHHTMYRYGAEAPCYSSPKMLEEDLNESLRCEAFKDWSYSIQNVDGSSVIRHHGIELTQKPPADK